MEKCLYTIILLLCCSFSFAQDKKLEKNINKAIETNDAILEALKLQLSELKEEYNVLNDSVTRYSKRSFSPEITEDRLEKYLGSLSLKDIYSNKGEVRKMLSCAKETSLTKTYLLILNMQESLNTIYDKSSNTDYGKLLDNMKPLNIHQDEFNSLSAAIQDYRFVMFELARVFKLVDKMEYEGNAKSIYAKLEESNETEFINDNIPYAVEVLKMYIDNHLTGGSEAFEKTKRDLYNACPEAFSEFNTDPI